MTLHSHPFKATAFSLNQMICVSGKTRGAEKLIADSALQEGRVLIVSNRVTLAHDHISIFNKVVKAAWLDAHSTE